MSAEAILAPDQNQEDVKSIGSDSVQLRVQEVTLEESLWPPMTFAAWLFCSEPRSARPVQSKALRHTQTPDSHSVTSDVTSQAVTTKDTQKP
ncbi:hypothetical protein NQZ68_031530 [Dissostichus eleginoides]|nr:hypothetical protein NQZ68_031530 [Dissostichus eleginoides]